jgi:hypothetical protein
MLPTSFHVVVHAARNIRKFDISMVASATQRCHLYRLLANLAVTQPRRICQLRTPKLQGLCSKQVIDFKNELQLSRYLRLVIEYVYSFVSRPVSVIYSKLSIINTSSYIHIHVHIQQRTISTARQLA